MLFDPRWCDAFEQAADGGCGGAGWTFLGACTLSHR